MELEERILGILGLGGTGSATRETRAAMGQLVIDNLDSWFQSGKLLTEVFGN